MMFRHFASSLTFVATLSLAATSSVFGQQKSDIEIAKIGKAASASLSHNMTLVNPPRAAAGFGGFVRTRNATNLTPICIHPSGSFLVYYGTMNLPENNSVRMVIHPQQKEETSYTARVIRRDDKLKIALLQTIQPIQHPAVSLAENKKWQSETEFVTFGYPASMKSSFNRTAVNVPFMIKKSQVKKIGGNDAKPVLTLKSQPGISGGPILNRDGKLAGFLGSDGAINPIQFVRPMLEQPIVVLSSPPLTEKNSQTPVDFQVRFITLNGTKLPEDMSVQLTIDVKGNRRSFEMKLKDGVYRVTAVPVPPTKEKQKFPVQITFSDGTLEGFAFDQKIHIDKEALKLSNIFQLQFSKGVAFAILAGREKVAVRRDDLETIKIYVDSNIFPIDLKRAEYVAIGRPKAIDQVACSIEATQNGNLVCRSQETLPIANPNQNATVSTKNNQTSAVPKQIVDLLFGRYDTNNDGKIDKKDAANNPTVARFIDRMDRNNDGAVTRDEIEFYYQNRTRFTPAKGGFGGDARK